MYRYLVIIMAICLPMSAKAQFVEDALRLSSTNGMIAPRAGGLNVAFNGLSDDFSALYFNPAGLASIYKNEISFGFGFMGNNEGTDFFNNLTTFKSNDAYLTHAGIVSPFKTAKGNAAFALGYYLESNLDNNLKFNGFNDYSSFAANAAGWYNFNDEKLADSLYLAGPDGITPVTKNLQQEAIITESGGIHNISGGAAFDLNNSFSVGFSLTGKFGDYNYRKNYSESDINHLYEQWLVDSAGNYLNVDFSKLEYTGKFTQHISGITAAVGIQGRIKDFVKIGATIKFPTYYSIEEDWNDYAGIYFDNGQQNIGDLGWHDDGVNDYNLTTPWIFSFGLSAKVFGVVLAAGLEYSDVTQMEFSNATDYVLSLNDQIISELTGQVKWGAGAEYTIPAAPVMLRASFESTSSPYMNDISGADITKFSFGAGIYLANNIRLDAVARNTKYSRLSQNYGEDPIDRFVINANLYDFGLQLTYRYE